MRASQRFCFGWEVGRPLETERKDRPPPKYVRKCIVAACDGLVRVELRCGVVFEQVSS